jgi:hypothetical protein
MRLMARVIEIILFGVVICACITRLIACGNLIIGGSYRPELTRLEGCRLGSTPVGALLASRNREEEKKAEKR